MPITQDRMLSLIGAAQDYEQALTGLVETINSFHTRALRGELSVEDALSSLAANSHPGMLLKYPLDTPVVLRIEATHFAREKRRNARKAEKLRENRMADFYNQPRPQRGHGAEHGRKGASGAAAASRQTIVAPSFHKTAGHRYPEKPEPVSSWASQVPDPDAALGAELDLEAEPGYVPGTLSPETRARLEEEARAIAAREQWEAEGNGRGPPAGKED